MNTIRLALLALLVCAAPSFGGEIYGTIKENGRPVGQGVTLEIQTSAQVYHAATDGFGNYRVIVPEVGKSKITVHFANNAISGEIQSYPTPVRFDWVLERSGNTYSLRRQ
jgi:hypothetical protein